MYSRLVHILVAKVKEEKKRKIEKFWVSYISVLRVRPWTRSNYDLSTIGKMPSIIHISREKLLEASWSNFNNTSLLTLKTVALICLVLNFQGIYRNSGDCLLQWVAALCDLQVQFTGLWRTPEMILWLGTVSFMLPSGCSWEGHQIPALYFSLIFFFYFFG